MKQVALADLLRPYARKWVAVNWKKDKVLASGATLPEVVALVKQQGISKPVYTFVPDPRFGPLPPALG